MCSRVNPSVKKIILNTYSKSALTLKLMLKSARYSGMNQAIDVYVYIIHDNNDLDLCNQLMMMKDVKELSNLGQVQPEAPMWTELEFKGCKSIQYILIQCCSYIINCSKQTGRGSKITESNLK